MKRKILGLVALTTLVLSCGSYQTTTTSSTSTHEARGNVPSSIQTTFTAQYPTAANVVWAPYEQVAVPIDMDLAGWGPLDAGDYVARFDVEGVKYYAWYDAAGDWIGTAYVLNDINNLPVAARDVLNKRYAGYAVETIQREMEKNRTAYEVKLKKSDDEKVKVLIDENGTILKEKFKD